MVPPDGARATRLPTLSWDSVVDPSEHGPASAEPVAESVSSESAVVFEPLLLAAAAESPPPLAPHLYVAEPATIRTTPPAVIVPAIGDVISGPELVAPAAAPVTAAIPLIQEATPVEPRAPMLPTAPAYTPAPRPATAPPFEFEPGSGAVVPSRQSPRRKKGRGLKFFATLVVLGGVAAAGVVFGQSYLFPNDWDDAVAPYAQAVEASRGVDFSESLSITAEPSASFAARLQAQLAPVSPQELAQWRALGLVSGVVDESTLAAQLSSWQDVLYSTIDGQLYHDVTVAGAELDAQLVEALAAASLDQEFGWSVGQPQRTLDAAAATSAEVLRQVRQIRTSSTFGAVAGPAPTTATTATTTTTTNAQVAALPPVIGYRVLAPQVFAEFAGTTDPNPLLGLGAVGPGPLGVDVPVAAGPPTMLDGDTFVDTAAAHDRSFWFLAFGGFLNGPTALSASEAIVENTLTNAVRGATDCVYATFSGSGVEQTETLRSALTTWVAAAPLEFGSSFTTLADGSLQLTSCDPGVGFAGVVRPGVVAELVAYRSLELATKLAVASRGGGDPEFTFMWNLIVDSNMPSEVAALAAVAPPSDIAAAAIGAVEALYSLGG